MEVSSAGRDMVHPPADEPPPDSSARDEERAFLVTAALGAALIPVAVGVAGLLSVDIVAAAGLSFAAVFWGVAACAPLVALLHCFLRTQWRPLAEFRQSQLKFFIEIGFALTTRRALVLAAIAGLSEELLFRGAIQTALSRDYPAALAVILPNIVFGALHARTLLYAVIAGLVGVYLGVCYHLTGSLAAPVITHALYDFVALVWTRKAIDAAGLQVRSGRADSSDSSTAG